jgi:hypothetical protein
LSIRNRSECGGEALSIPIEGSAAITETGAFFDEGTFASGIATYGISRDRPAGRRRGGPGLGGYSRITLRSGNARAIFYARAQATQ